jgi:hypothetical protein
VGWHVVGAGPRGHLQPDHLFACVALVVALYVVVAMYFVLLYLAQRRNLYISYRCPELLIIEVLINVLCVGVIGLREVMALNPPGHRLSCIAMRFPPLLLTAVTQVSQVGPRREAYAFCWVA